MRLSPVFIVAVRNMQSRVMLGAGLDRPQIVCLDIGYGERDPIGPMSLIDFVDL
jgi:hypothetical protein